MTRVTRLRASGDGLSRMPIARAQSVAFGIELRDQLIAAIEFFMKDDAAALGIHAVGSRFDRLESERKSGVRTFQVETIADFKINPQLALRDSSSLAVPRVI